MVRAETGDLDVLSELIAGAFHDLPPSSWLIGDPAARRQIFPAYFRIALEHGIEHGLVYTTPDWAGAALWMPAGIDLPTLPDGYDERLVSATAPWTGRFVAFDAALEARHPAGTPHHHLALLGVRPGRQGRGTGTALLQAHHQTLDEIGMPAYLEASHRANRRLYLKHGYGDQGLPIQLPAGGPSLFPMWRQPLQQALPDNPEHDHELHAGMTGVFRQPTARLI